MPQDLETIAPKAREDFLALLKEVAGDETQRVYAVLDGAQIENLPVRLENAGSQPGCGLAHAPLYRGEDRGKILAGPWLVTPYVYDFSLDDQYDFLPDGSAQVKENPQRRKADPVRQVDALFDLLEDPRAAVFWIGPPTLTVAVLYQHLRGLNRIQVRGEKDPNAAPQQVHFRHGDANGLAQVIPALDPVQTNRLLGPADLLVALPHPVWSRTAVVVQKERGLGTPPTGPLVFNARTLKDIETQRKQGFVRRIVAWLHKVRPGPDGNDAGRGTGLPCPGLHERGGPLWRQGRRGPLPLGLHEPRNK